MNTKYHWSLGPSMIVLSLTLALGGWVDDGDTGPPGMDGADGNNGTDGAPGLPESVFLIANNGDANRGTVSRVDQNGTMLSQFTSQTATTKAPDFGRFLFVLMIYLYNSTMPFFPTPIQPFSA